MTFELIGKTRVLISLCAQDMKDYSLEFDTMSLSDPQCKKAISSILSIACDKTGFNIKNGNLLIEALPYDNGCLILLSNEKKSDRRVYKIKKNSHSLCCVFDELESFIKAVLSLSDMSFSFYPNSAYFYSDKYYLIFERPVIPKKSRVMLSEYAKIMMCGRAFTARLKESGKLLANKNAVKTIGKAFR